MREVYYGKEAFDLRVTVLRLVRQLHIIAGVTILGTLLFGGGYYVKNVLLRTGSEYAAKSIYRVEYAVEEEKDVGTVYINETSWNTYVQTQNFIDAVQLHLAQAGWGEMLSDEELRGMITAVLASDLRMPFTIVTTESPEKSVRVAQAVEAAMTQEFAEGVREILSISVIDSGDTAEEVIPDVRTGRACVLSTVLSFFFAVVILLIKETGDDSIWLPFSLWKRYGIRAAGTMESRELAENLSCFFEGKQRKILCAVQDSIDPQKVLGELEEKAGKLEGWSAVAFPLGDSRGSRELREADGILLAVNAGAHAGRQFEYMKDYLEQQGCSITAAILLNADEKLIREYYFFRKGHVNR